MPGLLTVAEVVPYQRRGDTLSAVSPYGRERVRVRLGVAAQQTRQPAGGRGGGPREGRQTYMVVQRAGQRSSRAVGEGQGRPGVPSHRRQPRLGQRLGRGHLPVLAVSLAPHAAVSGGGLRGVGERHQVTARAEAPLLRDHGCEPVVPLRGEGLPHLDVHRRVTLGHSPQPEPDHRAYDVTRQRRPLTRSEMVEQGESLPLGVLVGRVLREGAEAAGESVDRAPCRDPSEGGGAGAHASLLRACERQPARGGRARE